MDFVKIIGNVNNLITKHRHKLRFLNYLKPVKKIPTLIWATFAIIGVLIVGVAIGISFSQSTYVSSPSEYEVLKTNNDQYLNVIRGYETLTDLYYSQGKSVSSLLGSDKLPDNQNLIEQLLTNIKNTRDLILVQEGRMLELRKNANLPPQDLQKAQ